MAYTPITQVAITISDVQVSTEGFGTPVFITTHRSSPQRVAQYTNAADVGDFYGLDSPAYVAAKAVFAQQPSVATFKVGRRSGELQILPIDVAENDIFAFTITNALGVEATLSYTALNGDADTDVSAALVALVNGQADAAEDVVASPSGARIVLAGVDNNSYFTVKDFTVDSFQDEDVWHGTETAAEVFQETSENDGDFYFITTDDNSDAFVKAMAAIVETESKLYFVSDSNADNLSAITIPDTSLFGELAALNYNNTVTLFHHDAGDSAVAEDHADADYPEVAYVGANAPYDAGSVSWSNLLLKGAGGTASQDPATGKILTPTQKDRLNLRNSNYIDYDSGNTFVRYGQTVGNEWIDTIRGVHWQTKDLTVSLNGLLLGQKGGKVTYDNEGITRVRETIATSLQRGVNRNFLASFIINMPRNEDLTGAQRNSRILDGVTFEAVLKGAINDVVITGSVSSDIQ